MSSCIVVEEILRVLGPELGAPGVMLTVAFSGGSDSSVLLHALARMRSHASTLSLRALHVNHQLHPDAKGWAVQCEAFCRDLGVDFGVVNVNVDRFSGHGLEAAAREARYGALAQQLRAGEILLTAHHRGDQAETVLYRLLRGAGPSGLAGIPQRMTMGTNVVIRPLLELERTVLCAYADRHALRVIDDPANADLRLDRNFLRHKVLPQLRQRWKGSEATLARSARLSGEAAGLLRELAAIDARRAARRGRLLVDRLNELSESRRRNLFRHSCLEQLGSAPGETRLRDGLAQLLHARPDRQPVLAWPGGEVRRYRDQLFFLPSWIPPPGTAVAAVLRPGHALDLGPLRGRLRLLRTAGSGIRAEIAAQGLAVGFRSGGETLRPIGAAHHRRLKSLLQEGGIVPWMRPHVPILYAGDDVAAVADLWTAAPFAASDGEEGFRVRWDRHPALR